MKYLYLLLSFFAIGFACLGQTFYKGVDLSYVNEMEDCGAVYYESGNPVDPFQIMANHGANLVRVRLWHNPLAWSAHPTSYSSFEDVVTTISRAKSEGLSVLLDFHYSDTWTDPGKQIIPSAWESSVNHTSVLVTEMYNYTYQVLTDLDNMGLMPELVQVGNETNGNMLSPEGADIYPVDWARQSAIINAGIDAVRDAGNESANQPKVVLHVADPNNGDWWFGEITSNGVSDFDVIGLSFYPEWHSGTVTQAGDIVESLISAYGKDVMLVEVGVPWTEDWNDDATNMLSSLPKGYGRVSPTGQRDWLIDISTEVSSRGGIGVIYWEPAWVSTGCDTEWGTGSHWENATFFDFNNELILNGGVQFLEQNYGSSNATPSAAFSFSVNNLVVDFDGSVSADSDGTISSWSWNFGDGATGSGALVNHTYGAPGDYAVTLTVTDNGGATDAATQVVSVNDGSSGEPTSMHVQSIVTGTENAGQGNKRGIATVTVHDDLEDLVGGVTVTGTFSGTFNETVSGQTDQNGTVTLTTSGSAKGSVTVSLCVDDLTHSNLNYNNVQNDITCTSGSARMSQMNQKEDFNLTIFPNPASNSLTLTATDHFTQLFVVDTSGRSIREVKHSKESSMVLDIGLLEPGIYFIRAIKHDGTDVTRKFVIK